VISGAATSEQPTTAPRARPGLMTGSVAPVLVVAAITLVFRLPTLPEPHHYGDEGIFAAVAQRLLQGHTLYTGAWDDKPPLIFWTYAAVQAVFGASMLPLRLLGALWAAGLAAAVTALGRRLLGPRTGVVAGLICAGLASVPFIEANLSLTELFAATPVAWAFVIAGRRTDVTERGFLAAGALLAVGFFYKQVAALDAAALGIWLLLEGRAGVRKAAILTGGFAAVCVVVAVVLAAQGALGEATYSVFGFYRGYLREGSSISPGLRAAMVVAPAIALVAALVGDRSEARDRQRLMLLWLGFASTGTLLAGRPYGHYLVQMIAPASLTAVLLAQQAVTRRPAVAPLLMCVVLSVVVWASFKDFWLYYNAVRTYYYQNAFEYATGMRSRDTYEVMFDRKVEDQYQLAELLRGQPERTLFVWGEYPWLYPLADAEAPVRYITSYHVLYHAGGGEDVIAALRRNPPRFIVWDRDEWRTLPGLEAVVAERYELVGRVHHTDVYRRR
jgi:4-amino-4-deoxy-L-arabinose transferase-like glycosyltransferase